MLEWKHQSGSRILIKKQNVNQSILGQSRDLFCPNQYCPHEMFLFIFKYHVFDHVSRKMTSMFCLTLISAKRGASMVITWKVVKAEYGWTFGHFKVQLKYIYKLLLFLCLPTDPLFD